jgi:hypothetical protein
VDDLEPVRPRVNERFPTQRIERDALGAWYGTGNDDLNTLVAREVTELGYRVKVPAQRLKVPFDRLDTFVFGVLVGAAVLAGPIAAQFG